MPTGSVPVVPLPGPSARVPTVSTGFAARLAEKAAARRHVLLRRALWVVAGLLVVGAGVWGVFFSPAFALDEDQVVVDGLGTVIAPGAVEKVVAVQVGTPLTRLDTVRLRARILEVPGVRDATIVRDWPRGLTVDLVSREPVAAVPEGGGFVLLDDEGVQVGRSTKVPDGLPEITFPLDQDSRRTLASALILLNALPAKIAQDVRTISATSPDDVQMELRGGATVVWGSSAEAALKVRVLDVLRSAKASKGSKVFDVSAPNAPITR